MRAVKNVGAEEALLSSDPITRIVARAGVSKWAEQFQQWVNDELNRGEDPAQVLIAIMDIQIMTHSSLACQFLRSEGLQALANGYKDLIDAKWVRHAEKSLEFVGRPQ